MPLAHAESALQPGTQVLTAQYMPVRPDMVKAITAEGKAEGRVSGTNSWPINELQLGDVYVADGFGPNNRIAKFNKDGNFLKTWGQTGSGQGQFSGIRGLASDAAGNIYVADSGNKRIQVFDGEGMFKSEIRNVGTPQAICVSGGPTQYLYTSNSNDSESMENGEIYKVQLNGTLVGRFGKAGKMAKDFGMVNAIDCRTENDLIVGEVWNWRAQRVTLRR